MTFLAAAKLADEAANEIDSAVRLMNDAEVPQFRDRAFEQLGFGLITLSKAVAELARAEHRAQP